MNILKKIFPASFMPTFLKNGGWLALGIVVYWVSGFLVSFLTAPLFGPVQWIVGILNIIPFLGTLIVLLINAVLSVVAIAFPLYCTAGIVILILVFAKVIKLDAADEVVEVEAAEEAAEEAVAEAAEEAVAETADAE